MRTAEFILSSKRFKNSLDSFRFCNSGAISEGSCHELKVSGVPPKADQVSGRGGAKF
jgi:hypothetical protein